MSSPPSPTPGRARGAKTAAITCNQNTPLSDAADIVIVAEVGPEVISGSTRMKAATAQKMITNMITTRAMTWLGYVYDNAMVNAAVHMQNSKLVERGISTLMRACDIDRRDCGNDHQDPPDATFPVALVMLKAGVDKPEAVRRLAEVRRATSAWRSKTWRAGVVGNVLDFSGSIPIASPIKTGPSSPVFFLFLQLPLSSNAFPPSS